MRHYESDQVSYIRDLLYEDYPLSSVFKELIQNAQDAGAQQLHFGWIADWPDDVHPLLRQPVLFALNDGGFSKNDYKSIGYIGSSAKGNDAGSIGTFGFGMKSVFHFCEAFLYAASPNQEASDGRTLIEVVTPWPKGTPHLDDWEIQESSKRLIMDRLDLWVRECPRWFCVLIPLRTEQQLLNRESIKPFFRQIRDFFPDRPSSETLCLTPLLKSLEKVTFWGWNSQTFSPEKKWCMFLDSKGLQRTRSLDDLKRTTPSPIGGTLYVSTAASEEASVQHRFSGDEILLPPAEFDELKKKREWPRTKNLKTSETAQYVPRKGEPHCAVLFSTNKSALNQNPQLQIDRAVFLPLAQMEESVPCRGNRDYRMILHGWYFLDKGRTKVLERVESGREIEEQWNKLIDKNGLWPMILPSLNKFVRETNLNADEINGLTEALRQSDIFRSHKEFICREHQWLRQISDQNYPLGQWRLVEGSKGYLTLPEPENGNSNMPFEVFPNLPVICGQNIVVFRRQPLLTAIEPIKCDYGMASEFLRNLGSVALESKEGLQYLNSFLASLDNHIRKEVSAVCARSLMRRMKELGIDFIKRHENEFFELLKKLQKENRVSLAVSSEILGKLVKNLKDLDFNQVILSQEFTSKDFEGSMLELSTSDEMLSCLTHDANLDLETIEPSALAVIERTKGNLNAKREKLGDYKLFRLNHYGSKVEDSVSWNYLKKLFDNEVLFDGSRIGKSLFLPYLQSAIPELQVYTISKSGDFDPFQTLFGKYPEPIGHDKCVKVLGQHPDLGKPDVRKPLLEELLNAVRDIYDAAKIKALRYLLHENKNKYDDTDTCLWIDPNYGHESIQNKLASWAFTNLPDRWHVVPHELAECLNEAQRVKLNIKQIDSTNFETLLSKCIDLSRIADLKLSEEERLRCLNIILNDDILRRLPIHRRIDGQSVSIDAANVFVVSSNNFRLSPKTENAVTLIERPNDIRHASVYDRLVHTWTPEKALRIALDSQEPSDFWPDILTSFQSLCDSEHRPSHAELIELLKHKPWIPTTNGGQSPDSFVILRGMEDDTLRNLIRDSSKATFAYRDQIIPKCQEQLDKTKRVDVLFPNGEKILKHLSYCFKESDKYTIGNLSHRINEHDFLDKFLLAFGNAPKEVCHTGSIVKTLLNNDYQRKSITEFFLRPLAKPLSKTRLKKLLDFLRTSHERANEDDKTKIIEVFNWYLALMVADNSPKDLSGIHFLNRVGTWKLSSQICLDADGIDPSDLLDKTQAEVLGNFIKISDSPQINRNRANTPGQEINVAEFHKYLRKFEDLVSIRTLGAFLSILGDGDKEHIKNLAKNYLRPENIDLFRDRIDWTPMGTPLETSYQVINENIHAAMAKQRFRFFLSGQNNNHFVHNLLGVFFKARESKDHNTIFLGDFENGNEAGKSDGLRSVSVTLRDIGDEELKRKNAFDLLFESALYLLKRVYGRHPSNLDDLWNEKGEQLDLKVAQEIILKHSVFYFRQLGSKRLTTLKQILNEWEDLETREEQIKIAGSRELSLKHGDIIANQERLRSELRRKLENESDVQSQLLEAVRHKIEEDFQYSEESIAFELFQNADDASRELLQIGGNDCYPKPDIFYMHWDNFRMVFAHSGRAINNQLRNRAFTYEDGVEAGFNRDLEKMLVMSYSDKGDQHWQVTGKFGLGFKSVFIVSKNPKVLSGSLGFEVLAGIYPRRLDQEDRSSLSRVLEDKLDNLNGTVFEIRFSEEFDRSPEEVTKRFRKTLPVLLVFSRQIKQCHLEDASESKITLVNSEREIGYCQGAFIADLHFPFNEEIRVGRVLVLRTGEFGALLLNLGPNGVCGLPEELPTFWNLAPLGSKGLGIAVNGNFRLDVGRAQIAESTERHQEVAQELGQGFGVILNRLYQASETDWQLLKQDLGLAADVTDHQMWESFWKTLGSDLANENSGQNRERDLCKQIFWQTGRGMAKLFESKDAMPSGLHGDYKQLTSLEKIRWCADGRLDSDEKVFKIISSWGTFRSHIPAEGNDLVSKSRIKLPLENLMSKKFEWNRVDIKSALIWELKRYPKVFPEQAKKLGTLITRNFMDEWAKNNHSDASITEELRLLREYLCDLQFKTDAGGFVRCQNILVSGDEETEESRKAAFAPGESVLHSTYCPSGIEFFRACRGPIEVPIETMKEWALKASSNSQQKAFLAYLSRDGEGWEDLLALISDVRQESWLQKMIETQAYKELEPYDKHRLNWKIGESEMPELDEDESEDEPEIRSLFSRHVLPKPEVLERIFDWWQIERDGRLENYEHEVYPYGRFFDLLDESSLGLYNQKEWLKMFLLGCLQTLGRTRHQQKKEFVKRSERLIGELTHSEADPKVWLKTFDQLIEHQIGDFPDYRSNLLLFGLYVIGRRLTDYIHSIMNVNNFPQGTFSLRQILVSRTSELYQRGGPDAPPINRVLGIGAHFLIRELYRKNILTHEGGYCLCYVPNSRVRAVLEAIGCPNINEKDSSNEDRSKIIFNFLKQKLDGHRALFKKDFDIPLQVIGYNRDLQIRFLGRKLPTPTSWAQEEK